MSFKDNLLKKIEIDRLARSIARAIGPVESGKRIDKTQLAQLINFFTVNDALFLVDLPGYGYAKVPEAVRRHWGPMIETYLKGRATLKAVVLILDIRRTPGIEEKNFIDWLTLYHRCAIPVLTKADKLSTSAQKNRRRNIADALSMDPSDLILFSAKTRKGLVQVWSAIESVVLGESHAQ